MEKTVGMRGSPDPQLSILASLSTENLIPTDHPIRRIRVVVDAVLADLDDTFDARYAAGGRRSVPLGVAVGGGELSVHDQRAPVFHQQMAAR